MKLTRKPVNQCHGCGLNQGEKCGVYECPHDMWHHRKCPGFKNEALLNEYLAQSARKEDERKEKRRATAHLRATAPRYQGRRAPVTATPPASTPARA